MADDLIDIREASRLSGYHPDHLRTLIRQGKIKARKVVIVWLVSRQSLEDYLKGQAEHGEKRGRKRLTKR